MLEVRFILGIHLLVLFVLTGWLSFRLFADIEADPADWPAVFAADGGTLLASPLALEYALRAVSFRLAEPSDYWAYGPVTVFLAVVGLAIAIGTIFLRRTSRRRSLVLCLCGVWLCGWSSQVSLAVLVEKW